MKKKVFFVLGNLRAGGSERVYWIISRYFNKTDYDVSLIVLDTTNAFFSTEMDGVRVIDLKTIKASRSFFKLYRLIKNEKPYAVFTTGHVKTLVALISWFTKIPIVVGRESNLLDKMVALSGVKDKFWDKFVSLTYKKLNIGICQSQEIKRSMQNRYNIPEEKLVVIPNPVLPTPLLRQEHKSDNKRLIFIGRLAVEKGVFRLLEIFSRLPQGYSLTLVGDGPLKQDVQKKIKQLHLEQRINLTGNVREVVHLIAQHDLLVLTSFTEGFPNVVLEALSVGVPVVSFNVSGLSAMVKNTINGYIVEQDDFPGFRSKIVIACNRSWDSQAIKEDILARFGVKKIVQQYENLLLPSKSFAGNSKPFVELIAD